MHRCAGVRGALADVSGFLHPVSVPSRDNVRPAGPLKDPGRAYNVREEARAHGLQKPLYVRRRKVIAGRLWRKASQGMRIEAANDGGRHRGAQAFLGPWLLGAAGFLDGAEPPGGPVIQEGGEHGQGCGGEADGIDGHDSCGRWILREDQLDPGDADAADAERRECRGHQRDAKAPEISGGHFIEQAEDMRGHDQHQPDVARLHDFGGRC